jgi:hypothetical protein
MPAAQTFEPIMTYTVPSDTNNFALNTISQSYDHLLIMCNIKSASPGAGLDYYMRVNGDASGNYVATRMGGSASSRSTARQTSGSSYQLFYCVAGSNAGDWTAGQIWIPYYTSTNGTKSILTNGGSNADAGKTSGNWGGTSAVNAVSFSSDAGFVGSAYIGAGSIFTIYGIKGA